MNCKECNKLLPELLFDEISSERRILAETHLESCESCRNDFHDLEKTKEILSDLGEVEKTGIESSISPRISVSANKKMPPLLNFTLKWSIAAAIVLFTLLLSQPFFQLNDDGFLLTFNPEMQNTGNRGTVELELLTQLTQKYRLETIQTVARMIEEYDQRNQREYQNALLSMNNEIERKRKSDLQIVHTGFRTLEEDSKESAARTTMLIRNLLNSIEIKGN